VPSVYVARSRDGSERREQRDRRRDQAEAVGGVTSAPSRPCNSEEWGRKAAQAEGGGEAIGIGRGRGDGRRELGAASNVSPGKG
jgi:hypothetical protein